MLKNQRLARIIETMKPNAFLTRRKRLSIAAILAMILLLGFFNNCAKTTTLNGELRADLGEAASTTDNTPVPQPTVVPSATATPGATPTPTATPMASPTPTPSPTATPVVPGALVPSLRIDFTQNTLSASVNGVVVANTVSLVRNSIATHYGSDGLIKTVAANQPRFDHDPTRCQNAAETVAANCARKRLGLLVEEARINRILQSSKFDLAPWTKGTVTTVTPNAAVAPDGTMTAYRLQMANVDGTWLQQISSLEIGKTYTLSLYARSPSGSGQIAFGIQGNTPNEAVVFNLTDQWQRFSHTMTAMTTGHYTIENNFTATSTVDAYIWGAQAEEAPFVTSYIPTTTSMVTRAMDQAIASNTGGWFNASEGTYAMEWYGKTTQLTRAQALFHMAAPLNTNSHMLSRKANETGASAQQHMPGYADADLRTVMNSNAWPTVALHQNSLSFSATQITSTDKLGATQDSKTKAIMAAPSGLAILSLGFDGAAAISLNGHIQKFLFYKKSILMDAISF